MIKKDVHLQLSEELVGIDIELDKAMEALSETNHRIDSFLNDNGESEEQNLVPMKTPPPNNETSVQEPSDSTVESRADESDVANHDDETP